MLGGRLRLGTLERGEGEDPVRGEDDAEDDCRRTKSFRGEGDSLIRQLPHLY